jgi:predicted GH43/DUF377 family glycosyl hydrolase
MYFCDSSIWVAYSEDLFHWDPVEGSEKVRYALGQALFSLDDPEILIKRTERPFLEPQLVDE